MIVSFNFYYALPGFGEAVLAQRLRACDVRLQLGLPRGRVLARQTEDEQLPEVVWELAFDDVDGHLRDMAARAASPAFEAVRAGMRRLYRRFERPLYEVCVAGSCIRADEATANAPALVTLDWLYGTPDQARRVAAAMTPSASGSEPAPAGSTLLRLITPGEDLPQLVWKREYMASAAGSMEPEPKGEAARVVRHISADVGIRVLSSRWSVR